MTGTTAAPRKRGATVQTVCPVCGNAFLALVWAQRLGRGRHCSRACSTEHMRRQRPPRAQNEERYFWAYVDKSGGPDACWPWMRTCDADGYGNIMRERKYVRTNRYALLLTEGEPPLGRPLACHSCDNPPCCNPRHLRWASPQENMDDKVSRGRASGNLKLADREMRRAAASTARDGRGMGAREDRVSGLQDGRET